VVDPAQLSFDIFANTVSLALPATLWAMLFLLAWEHGPFAESIGFGRWAFWLLLPGALLASFALLPIAPVSNDWVAISFAGALFPLLLGALAFGRVAPPAGRTLGQFLAFLAVESATLLLLVLPVSNPIVIAVASVGLPSADAQILVIAAASAAWTGLALGLFLRNPVGTAPAVGVPSRRALGFTLALTTAVLAGTFAASSAVPGVGIEEQFPVFLLPPLSAGFLASGLAPRVFPGREGFALPSAYFATTFGVLLGADLLRQPPLYGNGPSGLYTIGGAGVLDLVYLSGLIALLAAYLGHLANGRSLAPVGGRSSASLPTPLGLLGRSFREGVRGQLEEAISTAAEASREAAAQAGRLLEVPKPPPHRPWQGLPVPGWVVADHANLDALAKAGTTDAREGFRAWLTARWLVYLGRELGTRRFGSVWARTLGFLIDIGLMAAPAVVVWSLIAFATPGDLNALLNSVPFNAAIYGFVAIAFLYLVISETVTGTSFGKRASGLAIRDRQMRAPRFVAVLVRNVSVLPVLTVLGLGSALGVAFILKTTAIGAIGVAGVILPGGVLALFTVVAFTIGGIGLLGALGAVVIALTSERQRLGDLLAGTWVVRAPMAAPPAAASSSPAPRGPDRSG